MLMGAFPGAEYWVKHHGRYNGIGVGIGPRIIFSSASFKFLVGNTIIITSELAPGVRTVVPRIDADKYVNLPSRDARISVSARSIMRRA
jgi:hypothetical protein